MDKILPIGSVVRLKKGEVDLMIVNRAPLYNNNGEIGYFDYAACIYPIGITVDNNMFFFNEEDIENVIFEGYLGESEIEFQNDFNKSIQNVNYPHLRLSSVETDEGNE